MSKNDVDLKVDWATHAAAKYACEHWHYSRTMPMGKDIKVGAWEDGEFIGVVLFRNGAKDLGTPYGLRPGQSCELARIAMKSHKRFVSEIVARCIKYVKKQSPDLRIIVSFADPFQGHVGGVYQAGNWIYTGVSGSTVEFYYKGKWYHPRDFRSSDWSSVSGMDTSKLRKRKKPGKHRYLYPLDKEMRKQIEPLRKPYPKKQDTCAGSEAVSHQPFQAEDGGSIPTSALSLDNEV